ncbi:SAF domain-containing protein [Corynebacterium sp. H78]|uniref:SAF domain-containing protein n=1 Tax=Corynebacterium sp. H78 TaxID=3133417 RepID=UPI0030A49691
MRHSFRRANPRRLWRQAIAMFLLAIAVALVIADRVQPESGHVTVAVAARDISAGAEVAEHDVVLTAIPEGLVSQHSFASAEGVVGRRVATPIARNEVLTEPRFVGKELAAELTGVPNAHVVAITPHDQGILPVLHTGAVVDIFSAGQEQNSVHLIAPGARVLVTDNETGVVLLALPRERAGEVATASLDIPLSLVLSTMTDAA